MSKVKNISNWFQASFSSIEALLPVSIFIWAFSVSFPMLQGAFYFFFLVWMLFVIRYKPARPDKSEIKIGLVLLVFVLWQLITLFYTSNLDFGLSRVEKRIPLLLLSLILLRTPNIIGKHLKVVANGYYYGLLFAIVWIAVLALKELFVGYLTAEVQLKGIAGINFFKEFNHYVYIGTSFLMMFPIIISSAVNGKERFNKWMYAATVLIILALILTSGARALWLALVVWLILYSISFIKHKLRLPIIAIIVAGTSLALFSHPRIKQTIETYKSNENLEEVDSRFITWNAASEIIADHFMFGVGIGDYQDALNEVYLAGGHTFQAHNNFNVHNQFLQTWLESGLIGLLLLFALFYMLYLKRGKVKGIGMAFIVFWGIAFIFESVLLRNLGVFPFIFWVAFLATGTEWVDSRRLIDAKKWINSIPIAIAAIVIVSIFVSVSLNRFDPNNPKTYMAYPHKVVDYNNIPAKEQMEQMKQQAKFCKIDASVVDLSPWKKGMFQFVELKRTKPSSNQDIEFGIWCYVSEDCNMQEVMAFFSETTFQNREVSKYDMTKKGTWQYLNIEGVKSDKPYHLGLRFQKYFVYSNTFSGEILFGLPEIKVDSNTVTTNE